MYIYINILHKNKTVVQCFLWEFFINNIITIFFFFLKIIKKKYE